MKEIKKIQCHCCFNYTIKDYEEVIVEICPVCFWQYDWVAQEKTNISIGPNGVSLIEARKNYKEFGVSELEFKTKVREPLEEELPENNE